MIRDKNFYWLSQPKNCIDNFEAVKLKFFTLKIWNHYIDNKSNRIQKKKYTTTIMKHIFAHFLKTTLIKSAHIIWIAAILQVIIPQDVNYKDRILVHTAVKTGKKKINLNVKCKNVFKVEVLSVIFKTVKDSR